ncbi:androgen-induced gene 1 protein isoform X1 [Nomia melanderi]|uniref:androgen-induced gene 1 protein isoform X1 n=1 Tax=Nomia melanderi TaxID=2448451 RepID=UPI001304718F|nr:androgen-induced gene 1 protein-like isoform X1 [Nomia melanderi]XP_031844586.1 androgen-induced gene 1 protein-like isoform X1 [Nomia melanderi]XP_031844588.1 androgen-induced gene 1 protein-like isoform X1 [Nomia melanderi]XP_031844589.1 androgen-induced gene 1 protein-like isoform X1 [Nomia melanderi]XP_031844590.1 androgen-induced gene 1 protein-like isoform X1 [Nomia melanderi]
MTMRDSLLFVFHVISCVQFSFAVYYDYVHVVVPRRSTEIHSDYGGKFKFLTFWNAIVQAIFFFICMLNDWFGTNAVNPKKPPFIRKLKDFVHASFSFPGAMLVGIVFWTLMFIDRELIFPKALDAYFPWWLNHLMHTMIVVSILVETILAPRKYPKRLHGVLATTGVEILYTIWMHIIYYKSNAWVYPVMDVMSFPVRMVFIAALLTFGAIVYIAGEALDNFVWGNEHNKQQKSHAKSK